VVYVAYVGEMGKAYNILVGKPDRKKVLVKPVAKIGV
jgi:hypothetical protein